MLHRSTQQFTQLRCKIIFKATKQNRQIKEKSIAVMCNLSLPMNTTYYLLQGLKYLKWTEELIVSNLTSVHLLISPRTYSLSSEEKSLCMVLSSILSLLTVDSLNPQYLLWDLKLKY